jgi:hypothetical protein
LLLFRNILSGKTDLNIEAQTKQALRHDIGYQKYAMRHQLGEQKYRQNEKHVKKPEKASLEGPPR